MIANELERYLLDRIPLSRAMAVRVRSATEDAVQLFAPLEPNINHRDTVFGGSAAAVATLAAWSVIHVRLKGGQHARRIVIHRGTMHYERPITAGFTATAPAPDEAAWSRLLTALQRNRPARIRVTARLECEGARVGDFDGEFVVLPLAE